MGLCSYDITIVYSSKGKGKGRRDPDNGTAPLITGMEMDHELLRHYLGIVVKRKVRGMVESYRFVQHPRYNKIVVLQPLSLIEEKRKCEGTKYICCERELSKCMFSLEVEYRNGYLFAFEVELDGKVAYIGILKTTTHCINCGQTMNTIYSDKIVTPRNIETTMKEVMLKWYRLLEYPLPANLEELSLKELLSKSIRYTELVQQNEVSLSLPMAIGNRVRTGERTVSIRREVRLDCGLGVRKKKRETKLNEKTSDDKRIGYDNKRRLRLSLENAFDNEPWYECPRKRRSERQRRLINVGATTIGPTRESDLQIFSGESTLSFRNSTTNGDSRVLGPSTTTSETIVVPGREDAMPTPTHIPIPDSENPREWMGDLGSTFYGPLALELPGAPSRLLDRMDMVLPPFGGSSECSWEYQAGQEAF